MINPDDLILVSVDDHICEPRDMFEGHVPDKYRDQAPRVVEEDDGVERWWYGNLRGRNIGLNAAAGKLQWLMEMDAFLRFHGLPAARRDNIAELMKRLKLEGKQRGFLDRYLAAPTWKVMAQTHDGKHHFTQFGAGSLEAADEDATRPDRRR